MSFVLPARMHVSPHAGRGAPGNPDNRFARQTYEPDAQALAEAALAQDPDGEAPPSPLTQLIPDRTRSILAANDSPDIGFTTSLNPYRGCEHGCIYCYARPTHEYLDFSAGQDFETKIMVKHDAPALLRAELSSPRWQPRVVAMSGVTDCYQPAERQLRITRGCLEVFAEFRNPVGIITKNHGVTRDADLLADLARDRAAIVYISITTLDPELAKKMEPRASPPARRLAAIRTLAAAGVPVGVLVAPVIPGLTDHEGPAILAGAEAAGAGYAGWTMLRLPYGVSDLFSAWLDVHFPEKKDKVLASVRAVRGGKLNSSEFGSRMEGEGEYAEQITGLLRVRAAQLGLSIHGAKLSTAAFRRAGGEQLSLFA
jgi:DNA repair photolyase